MVRHGRSSTRSLLVRCGAGLCALLMFLLGMPAAWAAVPLPSQDPFYSYSGATPLARIAHGTVLKSRAITLHLAGLDSALVEGEQLLYRTTDGAGDAVLAVTTVLRPAVAVFPSPRVISYQIAYDALGEQCDPSYFANGGNNTDGVLTTGELTVISTLVTQGYTVVVPDYESTDNSWVGGRESGMATLDSLRAVRSSPAVDLPAATPIAMIGYSGGAIATEWAAELAHVYTPDVAAHLIGAAQGGVFVDPVHNLRYTDGSTLWASVIPAAILGISRSVRIDAYPYLNASGVAAFHYVSDKCIGSILGHFGPITYAALAKPQYADFATVRPLVQASNELIMSTGGTPVAPMFFGQGSVAGNAEGSEGNKPGIGPGDGVMVAGDVRTLARTYCARGVAVDYQQYDNADHIASDGLFETQAQAWLQQRFAGAAAPNNCADIAVGNSLAPLPLPAARTSSSGAASPSPSTTPTQRVTAAGSNPIAATGVDVLGLLALGVLLVVAGSALLTRTGRPSPRR